MYEPDRGPRSVLTSWIPRQVGGGYRYFTGSLAFVLHRITGLGLLVFLFFHILSVMKATAADPAQYDLMIRRMQEPDFKLGEILLFGALLFHGINGLRILIVDFVVDRSHLAKPLFYIFGALIVGLLIIGTIPLVLHWNVQPLFIENALPGGN
ncbi:MAG: succinate dehydrogenase, cytochrome b556 subunit [Planctomycetota bacterium]